MKKILFGLGLALTLSLTGAAQKNKKGSDATDPASGDKPAKMRDSSHGKRTSSSRNEQLPTLDAATNIQAQLQSTLDVRNAKVGDEVLLKTMQTVRQNGETVIPKGTALVGRITEVSQRAQGNAASRIGLVFERLQGHDLSAPITASINSITRVSGGASAADMFDSELSGGSQSSGSVGRRSSSGSGGLLGGVGSTVSGVVNTATDTVGVVAGTATQTVGGTTSTLGNAVNGIQISNSLSGSATGGATLSAPGKNLRIEKGVMFNMNVAMQ